LTGHSIIMPRCLGAPGTDRLKGYLSFIIISFMSLKEH